MNDKELIKALELARYAIEDAPVATCHQGTLDAAATRLTALAEENERLKKDNEIKRQLLDVVRGVVLESKGVVGWHLNGAVADWDELVDVHAIEVESYPYPREEPSA